MAEDFVERMSQLAEMIVERANHCHNEEQTKQSLIQPVIHVLGYDIFNPNEVTMEYACDAPVLKSRNGKPESVDYAIRIARTLAILIEAKDVSENLNRHGGQLARYFMSTECQHAVLTNGLEWRFFSDIDRDNVMDEEPYRIIDMRSLSTDDIMFLSGFRKDKFSAEELRSEAEKAMYASKINDYIRRNIIDSMSDEIVKVILKHVYDGIRSAAVVARFRPIIDEEFDKCVAEKYAIRSSLVRKTDTDEELISMLTALDTEDDEDNPTSISDGIAADVTFPIEVFFSSSSGSFDAKALYLGGNRMTILAGSKVAREEKPYIARTAHDLRERVIDETGILAEDVTVDSASMAGALVNGGVCDAGRAWKVADGRTVVEFLGARTWGEVSCIVPKDASHRQLMTADDGNAESASGDMGIEIRTILDDSNESTLTVHETTQDDAVSWPIRVFYSSTHRATSPFSATARVYEDGTTIVEAGSVLSTYTSPSLDGYAKTLREDVLAKMTPDANGRYVIQDGHEIRFSSASTAGAFVSGSSVNGNREWRDEYGCRLGELKRRQDASSS